MNELEKWVMSEMIDKLNEMEGYVCYMCDLAYGMFDSENASGSYDCSTALAKDWIIKYFSDLGDAVDGYKFNFGEYPANVFANPEVFQVQMIIYIASILVTKSQFVEDNWNTETTLTKEVIDLIIKDWENALIE